MKQGNWIALDKNLSKHFPDRVFSEIEAAFSLTIDYDNDRPVTAAGYAELWKWSRTKVNSFLDKMGAEISYPENTGKIQNQKGQIKKQIRDRSETDQRQIRMVDTKCFKATEDRSKTDRRQIQNRSKNTTNKPIINLYPKKDVIVSVVDYLNQKLGTNYRPTTEKTRTCINARIAEGNTYEQFKIVIDKKYNEWLGTDDAKYLRPETLFGNKFEGYLNQLDSGKKAPQKKLSFEKFQEAILHKKNNQTPGVPFSFKERALNEMLKRHPLVTEYAVDSKKFEIAFMEYEKL